MRSTRLETLRQSVETLAQYNQDGAPFAMRWGLYAGNELYPDVRKIYFQHFRSLLFGQTQAALLQTLSGLPGAPGPNDQYGPAYDTLKAYLITTSNHDKSTRLFLSPVLMKAWQAEPLHRPGSNAVGPEAVRFLQRPTEGRESLHLPRTITLAVTRARVYLSQFSGIERTYRFMTGGSFQSQPPDQLQPQVPGLRGSGGGREGN